MVIEHQNNPFRNLLNIKEINVSNRAAEIIET